MINNVNKSYLEMSDEEFFKAFLASFNIINSMQEGVAFIKDRDFYHVAATQKVLEWAKVTTIEEINQRRDKIERGADSAEKAQLLKNLSQYAEISHSKAAKITISIVRLDGKLILDLWHLSPIINPHTNNFLGIHGVASEFAYPHLLKFIFKINQTTFTKKIDDYSFQYKLTKRQQMILFLYLHRFSNTEISTYMTTLGHKISAGRVNEHLANLKIIFGVQTKDQLIEMALRYNFDSHIPEGFLQETTIDLDSL